MAKKNVLFVCTHNSARSQLAEGLLRAFHSDRYNAYSAGTEETFVKPHAIRAMEDLGLDITGHTSKTVEALADVPMDIVVTVCDSARETCPFVPARERNMHFAFADPSNVTSSDAARLAAFIATRDEIRAWLVETFGAEQPADVATG